MSVAKTARAQRSLMERRPDAELPAWLERLRKKFANTPEFKALSNELYNRIRDDVREDGLPSFSDLSENERRVMVGRAQAALLERESYTAAKDAAWRSLDVSLDAEADAWLALWTAGRRETKSGLACRILVAHTGRSASRACCSQRCAVSDAAGHRLAPLARRRKRFRAGRPEATSTEPPSRPVVG